MSQVLVNFRMDEEDKITITPTTGTSAEVTFKDGIEDGKYFIIAESKADSSKRKMEEIIRDKIEKDKSNPKILITKRGSGYYVTDKK